jgi:hypothetical protein
MRLMARLCLAAAVDAVVVFGGLAVVGDNRFGVLAVALLAAILVGFIARNPLGVRQVPPRRG